MVGKWKHGDLTFAGRDRLADLLEEVSWQWSGHILGEHSDCPECKLKADIRAALDDLRVKPKTALTEEVHILRNSLWNLTVNHGEMLDALTEKLEAHLADA